MTRSRLLAGLVALLALPALVACNGGDAEADSTKARPLSEEKAQAALLTRADLGRGYQEQPPDDDGDNEGMDCLSRAARDFDNAKAATEIELEYRKRGASDDLSEVSVLTGFSSYAEDGRAEATLDELRSAMQDCRTAEYEQGDASIRFEIEVSDDTSSKALDQQVNVTLDGVITSGETELPLLIELRYFRIANHAGTVSVSLLNAPDQSGEIERLVDLGVDRFVAVAEPAA